VLDFFHFAMFGCKIAGIQVGIGPCNRRCLLMARKCPEAAVDSLVLEAWQLVTEAVMGVRAAASVGGGVGEG
jgi:hypothetical protein